MSSDKAASNHNEALNYAIFQHTNKPTSSWHKMVAKMTAVCGFACICSLRLIGTEMLFDMCGCREEIILPYQLALS